MTLIRTAASFGRRFRRHVAGAVLVLCLSAAVHAAAAASTPIPTLREWLAGASMLTLVLALAAAYIGRLRLAHQALTRKLQEADELQRVTSCVTSSNTVQSSARAVLDSLRQQYPHGCACLVPISVEAALTVLRLDAGGSTVAVTELSKSPGVAYHVDACFASEAKLVDIRSLNLPAADLLPECRFAATVAVTLPDSTLVALALIGFQKYPNLTRDDLRWLTTFARAIALPMERVRMQEELGRLAYTDPMTGLANSRAFRSQLREECDRATRYGQPLSLLILDIDRFKLVNDTHGHAAGDEVLKHVADVVRAHVRTIDLPARYGGEEFAVLCPSTGAYDALVLAERLRAATEEQTYTLSTGQKLVVTLSIGAATCPREGFSDSDLFVLADSALYQAKRSGRNRVEAAATRLNGTATPTVA